MAKFLDRPEYENIWQVIRFVLCPYSKPKTTKNLFKGKYIHTKRAPEPSDICWENIGVRDMQVSRATVIKRRIATWTATAVVLAGGVVVIIFSSTIRNILTSAEGGSMQTSIKDQVIYNLLAFLPSSLVVVVNMVLSQIIRTFCKFERHTTITSYTTSVALKQTLAMFLNTAMAAIVVHWGDFYSATGLAAEIYNIMISNALVQPVAYIFSPVWVVKWACGKLESRKGEKCMLTQREANKLLEGRKLDMPHRYATLLKTFLFTIVYAPMMPLALVFGILAMVIQYWLDKVMLLRFLTRPDRLGHSLDEAMLRVIPIAAILYAWANWIFFWNFVDGAYVPGITGVVTASVYALGPWRKISKILRYRKFSKVANNVISLSESDKSYEEVAVDFVDDYDRANPLTTEEGHQYWLNLIRRKRGMEAANMMEDALRHEDSMNHKKLQVLRRQQRLGILLKSFVNGQLRRRHAVEEKKEAPTVNESTKSQPDAPVLVPTLSSLLFPRR